VRIAHLTSNDARTGGAQSVLTLHRALMRAGHESRVFCSSDDSGESGVGSVPRSFTQRAIDKAVSIVAEPAGFPSMVRPSFARVVAALRAYAPDVVHLHWTYQGEVVPLLGVPRLAAEFPLIWTFHDMWTFTGGCTNSLGCTRWQTGCGSCPQLADFDGTVGSMQRLAHDTTSLLWRAKRWAHNKSLLNIVAPSGWMRGCIDQSPMCAQHRVDVVPNAVDTDVFRPLDKGACRAQLGIAPDDRVVLFIGKPDGIFAYGGRAEVFDTAMRQVADGVSRNLRLLTVGAGGERLSEMTGVSGIHLGRVDSRAAMAACYNACDVYVNTTQFDNLPGAVQEAACCGVAMVVSDVGGVPDIVEHERTGIMCERDNPRAFGSAIVDLLRNDEKRVVLGMSAARIGGDKYCAAKIAAEMLELYGRCRAAHENDRI
jgi:glycosyltransferase involved in cell wall biosynthesis